MRITRQLQRGFTLVELMIAVAIIGILSAFALPAYQDYVIRAQVSEAIGFAGFIETAVTDYYAQNGSMPENATQMNLDQSKGNYFTTWSIQNGQAVFVFNSNANVNIQGKELVIEPTVNSETGVITWKCGPYLLATKYTPSSCRDSITLG